MIIDIFFFIFAYLLSVFMTHSLLKAHSDIMPEKKDTAYRVIYSLLFPITLIIFTIKLIQIKIGKKNETRK